MGCEMPRYIDFDKAIEDVERVGAYYGEEEEVKNECLLYLKAQPIADVVPRAEVEKAKQDVANSIIQEMQGRLNRLMYLEAPRHIQIECYLKVQIELDEVKKKYIGE